MTNWEVSLEMLIGTFKSFLVLSESGDDMKHSFKRMYYSLDNCTRILVLQEIASTMYNAQVMEAEDDSHYSILIIRGSLDPKHPSKRVISLMMNKETAEEDIQQIKDIAQSICLSSKSTLMDIMICELAIYFMESLKEMNSMEKAA